MDTAGAELLNQSVQSLGNVTSTILTNRAQKKLAEYSHQKDVEMWNMQNDYNNPANQMLRLKAAGLNPNLVYSSGNVTGNTGSNIPKYQMPNLQAPKVTLPNILNTISSYHDVRQKEAQVDATKEVVKQKKLENFYLGDHLSQRNESSWYKNLISRVLLGQDTLEPSDYVTQAAKQSPYMRRYNADVKRFELDNTTKQLEQNLMRKGIFRNDPMLLRMFIQNGMFDSIIQKGMSLFNK